MSNISFDEFTKLDIQIGEIKSVEKVPETDRLLKFEIDFGSEQRIIIGGWAIAYPDPTVLVGTQVPVLMNLEPRTIKGIESQGMILSAIRDDQPVALHPDSEVEPGANVR